MSEAIVIEFTVSADTVSEAMASIELKAQSLFGDLPYEVTSLKGTEVDASFSWDVKLTETVAPEPNVPETVAPQLTYSDLPFGNIFFRSR